MDIIKEYLIKRTYKDEEVYDSCTYCTLSDAQERVIELFSDDEKVINVTIIKQINTCEYDISKALCKAEICTYFRGE